MNIPIITFFNNKGGVGKTTMVYHLAWMLSDRGLRVIAADLDPQGNLSAAFLDEDRLEQVMAGNNSQTVFSALSPLKRGIGDIADPHIEIISDSLGLIIGDMALSSFEDQLSEVWPKCLDRDERAFRIISAFWRIIQKAGKRHEADVILIDLGPNLGAINRSALIASDFVVIPLGPDLFSLQGLRNLGPTLRHWRSLGGLPVHHWAALAEVTFQLRNSNFLPESFNLSATLFCGTLFALTVPSKPSTDGLREYRLPTPRRFSKKL